MTALFSGPTLIRSWQQGCPAIPRHTPDPNTNPPTHPTNRSIHPPAQYAGYSTFSPLLKTPPPLFPSLAPQATSSHQTIKRWHQDPTKTNSASVVQPPPLHRRSTQSLQARNVVFISSGNSPLWILPLSS